MRLTTIRFIAGLVIVVSGLAGSRLLATEVPLKPAEARGPKLLSELDVIPRDSTAIVSMRLTSTARNSTGASAPPSS